MLSFTLGGGVVEPVYTFSIRLHVSADSVGQNVEISQSCVEICCWRHGANCSNLCLLLLKGPSTVSLAVCCYL